MLSSIETENSDSFWKTKPTRARIEAGARNPSRRWLDEPRNRMDECSLAASTGSRQRDHLAGVHRHCDVVEHRRGAVAYCDAAEFQAADARVESAAAAICPWLSQIVEHAMHAAESRD